MTLPERADVVVIGGGIAGASAAYELAAERRVVLLEREDQPGYHSTGRSAAMLIDSYGVPSVHTLTRASRPFLESPPEGFTEAPLLSRRGVLHVARADQRSRLDAFARELGMRGRPVTAAEAREMVPALSADAIAAALLEADAHDIDVHALHHGYLRGLRRRGGTLVAGAEVTAIERTAAGWRVGTRQGSLETGILVNAAGAWADEVAGLAGVAPLGLEPRRRTAMIVDPGPAYDVAAWPMVIDVDEALYFKPDAGRLLVSPADQTPSPPSDAQPEDIDVAIAIDRLQQMTGLAVARIERRWAGLRTFAPDGSPVAGPAADADGFFWLAGQGGYGIMTAPGMARALAALVAGRPLDSSLVAAGVTPEALAPGRPLAA